MMTKVCAEKLKKVEKKGHNYIQWMIAMLVNMTLFTYGMQVGWVSPITKVLKSEGSPTGYPLSDYEISWIASVVCLTALLTVRLYSPLVDKCGRKTGVMIIAVFQALCWITKCFASNTTALIISRIFCGVLAGACYSIIPLYVWEISHDSIRLCWITKCFASSTTALIISRIFCGVPAGACYSIIPLYVREISHDNIRGKLGSLFILFQNTGILVMYAMGAFLDYYTVLYIVTALAVAVVLVFAVALPETPMFLVKMEKTEQAASTLSKLRGLDANHELIKGELDAMKKSDSAFKSLPDVSFVTIFKNQAWRRGFFIIMTLVITQSMSGNFACLTYAPAILSASGVTISPELQTLSFPIFLIFGSFISMNIVERFGRKILLTSTFLVGVVNMAALGTVMVLLEQGRSVPAWIPVVALATYFCAYAAGIAPMPYIVMAEMFNFQIRARLMGVLVTMAWCTSFVQLFTFTPISKTFGPHTTFYFYMGINLIGGAVSLLFLPETKGKSAEAIEAELGGCDNK